MSDIDWTAIMTGFAREFRTEEIGTAPGSKGGGRYVDARSIDERLDEVVGPQNWHIAYRTIDLAANAIECTLTVHGIDKSDVGYSNSPAGTLTKQGQILEAEPLKAAYSDALKRAAVHWGIGRYLYPYASKRQREGGEAEHTEPSTEQPTRASNYTPTEVHNPRRARQTAESAKPTQQHTGGRPALDSQLKAIRDLSRQAGTPEDPQPGDYNFQLAGARIQELQSATRQGGQQ